MKKPKRRVRISMAQCRDRMQWLEGKLKHEITPRDLIKDAKDPKTPYHRWFTWNKEKGFWKNLLYEARVLIGKVKVIYRDLSGNQVSARRWVHLSLEQPATHKIVGTYVHRERAMKTSQLHQQMVELACKDLETWKARYSTFKRIEIAFGAIDHAIKILKSGRFRKVASR